MLRRFLLRPGNLRLKPSHLVAYVLAASTLLFVALTDKLEWEIQTQSTTERNDTLLHGGISSFESTDLPQETHDAPHETLLTSSGGRGQSRRWSLLESFGENGVNNAGVSFSAEELEEEKAEKKWGMLDAMAGDLAETRDLVDEFDQSDEIEGEGQSLVRKLASGGVIPRTWTSTLGSKKEEHVIQGGFRLNQRSDTGTSVWLSRSDQSSASQGRKSPDSRFSTGNIRARSQVVIRRKWRASLKSRRKRRSPPLPPSPALVRRDDVMASILEGTSASQGRRRRPKWIEELQKQDRLAINSKLGVTSSSGLGVDSKEPDSEDLRAAHSLLKSRIAERESLAQEQIRRWRSVYGHEFPPSKTRTPQWWDSAPGTATLLPDLGVIVLYVHKRGNYLRIALESLSRVKGISDMLLIVSHDGFYEDVDAAVKGITFCRVKQIYFPYSAHMMNGSFPATSQEDCVGSATDKAPGDSCFGTPDSFHQFRQPSLVSLKHHWFWLMNTVWDTIEETRDYKGHILFIEEDHFLFPNILLQLRGLILAKQEQPRFASCVSVHAAPATAANPREAGLRVFVQEKMGNVGYAFNQSIWNLMKRDHKAFCYFDDYNWDMSLAAGVHRFWPYSDSLRWSRTSAVHFGNCRGLHEGGIRRLAPLNETSPSGDSIASKCIEPSKHVLESRVLKHDVLLTVDRDAQSWSLGFDRMSVGFGGYGGWGDSRDQELCVFFATGQGDHETS